MRKSNPLYPVILTVFLDMLGVGIIIPVIPALFFDPGATFFADTVSRDFRSVTYGLLLASFPFMQFFGAPMLGALSDRFGRKPLLMVSLAGTMAGYLLFAWAVATHNIVLLFISRMLPGFFGGNISIVYSAIADLSNDQSRTRNFGLVGMSFGLGFILGPTIGGLLADKSIVSWFGPETPFLFTAGLTFLNLLLVKTWFRETNHNRSDTSLQLFQGFRNIALSFSVPSLRIIFQVVLLLSIGFSFFTQFFSVLLIEEFEYSEKDIGFLYAWIGLWLVITQGFFVRILSRRVGADSVLPFSLFAMSFFLMLLLLPSRSFWFYLINPMVAISQGITSPNLTTVVSVQAGADRQGEVLGINQSMLSLGQLVPPLIAGYLTTFSNSLPLVAASFFVLAGWAVYVFVFRRRP